jgi:putative ABC transport system permease protein
MRGLRRIARWLRTNRDAASLAEEIEQHRARAQAEFEARGMTRADAAAASRRVMGNISVAVEDARDVWILSWIDRLWRDVRFGVRGLRREPGFAAAAILTLALGVTATTTVFSVADAELWRPLPFPAPHELISVRSIGPEPRASYDAVSGADLLDGRAGAPALVSLAAVGRTSRRTLHLDTAESALVSEVTPNYFATLGRTAIAGVTFDRGDACGPNAGVITDRTWRRLFNSDPAVVGRTVRLDDDAVAICGVVAVNDSLYGDPDMFVALDERSPTFLDRSEPVLHDSIIGRLRPGVEVAVARAQLSAVAARIAGAYPARRAGHTIVVEDLRLAYRTGVNRSPLFFFLGASLVVLVLSAVNVAALLLSRAFRRRHEFALRGALGGGQAALARQLLVEGALIAGPGGALGVVFAMSATGFFTANLPPDFLFGGAMVPVDLRAWAFASAVTTLTTGLFALVPLVLTRRIDLSAAIGSGQRTARSSTEGRANAVLLTAQIAFTVILIAGAGIFLKSFVALSRVSLGFDPRHAVAVRALLTGPRYASDSPVRMFAEDVTARLRAIPGVVDVAAGSSSPLGSGPIALLARADRPKPPAGEETRAIIRAVSPGHFRTLRIPIVNGREFLDTDVAGAPRVAVINVHAARKLFGDEDAIGRKVEVMAGPRARAWTRRSGVTLIVGVTSNIKEVGINEMAFPDVYLPFAQAPAQTVEFVLRTSAPLAGLREPLKRAIAAVDPAVPVTSVSAFEDRVARALQGDRFNTLLVSTFALLAVLLAAVGIHGAIAYAVAGRTREFGVRLALGAQPSRLVWTTLWQWGRLGVIGGVLGIAATLALARVIGNAWYLVPGSHNGLLYEVTTTDPAALSLSFAAIILVALAAAAVPARRVGRVDPVLALRSE